MAYQPSSGAAPAGADLEAPPTAPAAAAGDDDPGKDDTIHIQADMLPPGVKVGDCLHCTGMDENGCQFELEKGEGPATGESWEDGFRKEMSAMAPKEEAS